VDAWRQQQLWKEASNPKSRYSRFFSGSLETLGLVPEGQGIDVHSELKAFYDREYSANRMKLCVLGRESLDDLQDLVLQKFAAVVNKGAPTSFESQSSLLLLECMSRLHAGETACMN
jgi:insulysin